jgi:hypothetical protein
MEIIHDEGLEDDAWRVGVDIWAGGGVGLRGRRDATHLLGSGFGRDLELVHGAP